MTRTLFFSFFIRIIFAFTVVALMRIWFTTYGWMPEIAFIVACAAISAILLAQSVRKNISSLETATIAIGERPTQLRDQQYQDFDGLAHAISTVSTHVERLLAKSSESRNELVAMIDSMQDAVVAVDQAGRIQWSNQHMRQLLPGVSLTGSVRIGHSLVQTIRDPDVLECVRIALENRIHAESRSTSMMPGHIFEVNVSPMPGGGAVAVLHNITRIEQAERTQRDFVANVSHELRTPLTSISGYAETLLDHEASLSKQAREFLETIHKNAIRMNRLTEDLLIVARLDSSEQDFHPADTPASLLVCDAVQAMRGLVQDAEAMLEIGQTTSAKVFADSDSVVQVLSNLIENGIKYGQPGPGLPARVVVSSHELPSDGSSGPTGFIEFRVRDFGKGIASEHLTRIFERFYRVEKARSRESGGTGLGLAIALHIIQSQGGNIRAESELNAGSTFIFTLPQAQVTRD